LVAMHDEAEGLLVTRAETVEQLGVSLHESRS
jgi:hypothetical protein